MSRPGDFLVDASDSEYLKIEAAINEIKAGMFSDASTVTRASYSASNQTILSANRARRTYKIYNDSDRILYVKEGAIATTTDFSYKIKPEGFYEPRDCRYRGRIDGIGASGGSGGYQVTELS